MKSCRGGHLPWVGTGMEGDRASNQSCVRCRDDRSFCPMRFGIALRGLYNCRHNVWLAATIRSDPSKLLLCLSLSLSVALCPFVSLVLSI